MQFNQIIGTETEQPSESGVNSKNGYRERRLDTCAGRITLRTPKLRSGSFFPEDVVERYRAVDHGSVSFF